MKKVLSLFLILCAVTMHAQNKMILPLWPDGAPNDNGLKGEVTDRGDKFIGNISSPRLHVFLAKNPNGKAVIMCPGGGYAGVMMTYEGTDMADWYNAQGISYFVLEYRMPNGHYDVPLSDAEQAIRMVREHADEWKINKRAVGISGASAGGHLAASLGTLYSSEETRPDFQILFYPVITMKTNTHGGSRTNLMGKNPKAETVERFTLEEQVTPNTPPAFIMLSADDKVVPVIENGIAYAKAFIKKDVPVSLHLYPIGGHGWGFKDAFVYKQQWTNELEKWLRETVK